MSQKGFTLIELMIVVSIIAVLSSMGFAAMSAVMRSAKRAQTHMVLAKVDAALRNFRTNTGFYPKGEYSLSPYDYETTGFNKGLIRLDPEISIPITANDTTWAPAASPSTWNIGNGLFGRLGTAMTTTEMQAARINGETMRSIEKQRFYHIGNFGNMVGEGITPTLGKPGGWTLGTSGISGPQAEWAFLDATGPVTLGEMELKRVYDHFRMSTIGITTAASPALWSGWKIPNETGTGSEKWFTSFAAFMTGNFQRMVTYARPRDMSDAYQRVLRNGIDTTYVTTFDSAYNNLGLALANGGVTSRTDLTITAASKPWSESFLLDLEARYHKDSDGDGAMDVVDGYGRPLIYINEGMPAAPIILPRQASLNANPVDDPLTGYTNLMLHYHPDPSAEPDARIINANTALAFVTDKVGGGGPFNVEVRSDAYDISILIPGWGTTSVFEKHGCNTYICGDPYKLAGTLLPSRMRVTESPIGSRSLDRFFCLSKDQSTLVEPFSDANGNGSWDAGEYHIDIKRNGAFDSNIKPNDYRVCAESGKEREFELISAGPNGFFHSLRNHPSNADNLEPKSRK